jgi:kynureninase
MNSNSMGALGSHSRAAIDAYFDTWQHEGVEAWNTWSQFVIDTGDKAARLFGGAPGRTSLGQNVAGFQAAVASCLDFSGARNRVVSEALMFPNVLYVWERFSEVGAQLHLVPSHDGINVPTERILEAIDERTAIVTVSHAVYVSGALLDIEAICRRAREVGALSMIDVYQTCGTVPFDVQQWGADLVVGGSHKWLCGGPGTAFLYVRPGLSLRPRTTGWMAHADPFAFEPAPIRLADSPWRMMSGTPSIPAYYVANAAYDDLLEIGIPRIRAHNLALSQRVIERARAAGLTVHSPLADADRTGFVAVDFEGSEAASHRLVEERFKHDWRPNCGLRIGPHFYNTADEVDRFMDRMIELAGRT